MSDAEPPETESETPVISDALRSLIRSEVRAVLREELVGALQQDSNGADELAEAERDATAGSTAPPDRQARREVAVPQPTEPDHPTHSRSRANLPANSLAGREVHRRLEGEELEAYQQLSSQSLGVWNAWAGGDSDAPQRLDALEPSHRAQAMAALGLRWLPPPTQQGDRIVAKPRRLGDGTESAGELVIRRVNSALGNTERFGRKPATTQAAADAAPPERAGNKPPPSVGAVIALALLLGMFGAHRFYLGDKKTGLIQLLMFIPGIVLVIPPFITAIWAIVDAIRSRQLVAQFS